ncbi:hypothetical protein [Kitasatospora sp. NPDC090091]|uniref:hypothetical protein n=1 Tax=Kitasatospora sp. NPDC090091 TaxID=3364081 RepID=UPI00382EDD05
MNNRARRWTVAAALAAATALGASTLAAADTAPDDNTAAPPAVEDFAYPGTAPNPVLKLVRGDGHINLVDCDGSTQIRVWSAAIPTPNNGPAVCFRVTGATGYLALELPGTFHITSLEHPVQASVTSDGITQSVDVPKDGSANVGVAIGQKPATLLELRVTG